MKTSLFFLVILCISIFFIPFYCPLIVTAEERAVSLEEVIVTATRIDEKIEETTSNVIVIKSEDIKKMNVQFVTDILRKIPDLNLIQNGGAGKVATMLLRGSDSTHTLVMIDGIKVNSTTTGSFDFSGINVNDIERIEIVKGPQSTLYGSEAMAGVLNIITKKGEGKTKTDISFEAGSYGTYNPSLTMSGGYKKIDYRLTANHFYTDGISAAKNGKEKDGYKNSSLSGKFGFSPSEKFEFEITGMYYYDRTELDGFDFLQMEAADDSNFVQRGIHYVLSGKGKVYLYNSWEQIITVSTTKDLLKFKDPDTTFNNYEIITQADTVDWQHNFYLSDAYTLTGGAEYRKEKGEVEGSYDSSLDNKALYLNNKIKFLNDIFIVNAGLRYDDHETFGNKTTYRIGALYTMKTSGITIRSSYSSGFRAPTLNELFFPFYGNLNLKAEESTSWEVGIKKNLSEDKMHISLTYFEQEYKNLIQTDPVTFTASNISKAEIKGIEIGTSLKLAENIAIHCSYTYLDTEDKNTGQRLTRRPKDKFSLSTDFSSKHMSLVADYIFLGKRYDASVNRDLSSYYLVNLAGNYRMTKYLTIFMRIDNLFDKDYEEAGSYGTPGFSVYGGVRVAI